MTLQDPVPAVDAVAGERKETAAKRHMFEASSPSAVTEIIQTIDARPASSLSEETVNLGVRYEGTVYQLEVPADALFGEVRSDIAQRFDLELDTIQLILPRAVYLPRWKVDGDADNDGEEDEADSWHDYWDEARARPGSRKVRVLKVAGDSTESDDAFGLPVAVLADRRLSSAAPPRLIAAKLKDSADMKEASQQRLLAEQTARSRRLRWLHEGGKTRTGTAASSSSSSSSSAAAAAGLWRRPPSSALAASAYAGQHSFATIRALPLRPPFLPPDAPSAAQARELLARLAADRGVRETMRRRGLAVGLLTEMDPRPNTTVAADGATTRLLGLNRNRGEVIELRLRTDDLRGFRHLPSLIATLCHELAHNVHADHDARFWQFYRDVKADVARLSWDAGRAVDRGDGHGEFAPSRSGDDDEQEEDPVDHCGYVGGTYVLGGFDNTTSDSGSGADLPDTLTRREVLAMAADARRRSEAAVAAAPKDSANQARDAGGQGKNGRDDERGGGTSDRPRN